MKWIQVKGFDFWNGLDISNAELVHLDSDIRYPLKKEFRGTNLGGVVDIVAKSICFANHKVDYYLSEKFLESCFSSNILEEIIERGKEENLKRDLQMLNLR